MPTSVTLTPRKIFLEDFDLATTPAGGTASVNVLGAPANPVTLTKLSPFLLTSLGQYANDAAAAAGGVGLGALYWNTADGKVHARLT